ncbi:MAG: hypothetical protein A2104_01730 [Candidatus Melainabacteria bacterium GWF2_32_7]|nr:MAG: hypothetical protein A2104_01730 [Candidatus Melainabacteria bacterium GWF2_32_7]
MSDLTVKPTQRNSQYFRANNEKDLDREWEILYNQSKGPDLIYENISKCYKATDDVFETKCNQIEARMKANQLQERYRLEKEHEGISERLKIYNTLNDNMKKMFKSTQ